MAKSVVYPQWLADLYDPVYGFKDYWSEARSIRGLIRKHGPPRPRTLLDVACGTGHHLAYLRRWFRCEGLDQSPGMLRHARRRLGSSVRLHRGDMRAIHLRRRYDVVTCLFSAIGNLSNLAAIRSAIRSMGQRLTAGGVLLVEPWIFPEDVRAGRPHLIVIDRPNLKVARLSVSFHHGSRLDTDLHHLIARPRRPVEYRVLPLRTRLTSKEELRGAFRAAGLRVRFIRDRRWKRGLFIGKRMVGSSRREGRGRISG
jgi:SAM-dependent methyltransferase